MVYRKKFVEKGIPMPGIIVEGIDGEVLTRRFAVAQSGCNRIMPDPRRLLSAMSDPFRAILSSSVKTG